MAKLPWFLAALAACTSVPSSDERTSARAEPEDLARAYALRVSAPTVGARQHFGGADTDPLVFTFTVPSALRGGGLPAMLHTGQQDDTSILQIELPQMPGQDGTDEEHSGSMGVGLFDGARLCRVGRACADRGQDGNWRAFRVRRNGTVDELQMAIAMRDAANGMMPYRSALGVYLSRLGTLQAGEQVRLEYTGHVPARATEWTGRPFLVHFRYRSTPGAWTVLADDAVQGMQILPDPLAAFVKVAAPMDVQVGETFPLAVIVTDRYGNPRPIEGSVQLEGAVTAEVPMAGRWRAELDATLDAAGAHRLGARLDGARAIGQWTVASVEPPATRRLLGDVHMHTGDGGAQRKFLGSFMPGDHAALTTRTSDALGYLERVAGYDFGAVSEHAVRDPSYALPPAVAGDAAFATDGACAGLGRPIPGVDDWWSHAQSVASEYARDPGHRLLVFPAFEWHSQNMRLTNTSPLHRVVMFRGFAPEGSLPILPGDVDGIPPQCLVRFLTLAGYGPDQALVIPHMMQAGSTNIDWDLTYADSSLAPRADVEAYTPVGELFSARSYDQGRELGRETLTAFEGDETADPGGWTYRYGWRDLGARIGVIGSSDNHSQTPGVDDALPADGTAAYHTHEPAGTAVVLASEASHDGVYAALGARRSYATTGVRVWLDFAIDDAAMGSAIGRVGEQASARIAVRAAMTITRVELWATRVGSTDPYELAYGWQRPDDGTAPEEHVATVALANPVAPLAAPETWLYYVRAFFETIGAEDGEPEDAAWSSPIWVQWE